MRRSIVNLASALLTPLLLAGCSGDQAPPVGTQNTADDSPAKESVGDAPKAAEAESAQRVEKLSQVGVGLERYIEGNFYRLPSNITSADGKPLMSWRVAMLPVMNHDAIYKQLKLDEPWDSAHNAPLLKQVNPRLFASHPKTPDGHADVLAVIGEKLGFSPDEPSADGRGGLEQSDIADGIVYTALLVQVDPARSVPWAKPGDYTWNQEQPSAGLGASDEAFFYAVFGYGRVTPIRKDEKAETLRLVFGRNDGVPYDLTPVSKAAAREVTPEKPAAWRPLEASNPLILVPNKLFHYAVRHGGVFPKDIYSREGKPLWSWRVELLPSYGYEEIYNQLRPEPWDSEHNAAVLKQVPGRLFAVNPATEDGNADVLAVRGDEQFGFLPEDQSKTNFANAPAGLIRLEDLQRANLNPDEKMMERMETEQVIYTALLVQVEPSRSVPWAKPADYEWRPDQTTAGLGVANEDFFYASFSAGDVRRVPKTATAEMLRAWFNGTARTFPKE